MSGDFIIDPPGRIQPPQMLSWMPSRGLLLRVVDFAADEVGDKNLSKRLRDFAKGEYGFFSLSVYTEEQAEEIMTVIQESLCQRLMNGFQKTTKSTTLSQTWSNS